MTVQYSGTAATASFSKFMLLLFRWKGSVWKATWPEVLVWTILTVLWSTFYAGFSNIESLKDNMETFMSMIKEYSFDEMTTLLVGFTTALALTRWLDQYRLLIWPDNFCQMFNSFFNEAALPAGKAALLRKNVKRYLNLSYVLLMRDISTPIRKIYPDYEVMKEKGLLTDEDVRFLKTSGLHERMCAYWIPLIWIFTNVKKFYLSTANRDTSEKGGSKSTKQTVMTEQQFMYFTSEVIRVRGMLGDLMGFDWIPIPVVLVQLNIILCYTAVLHNVFWAAHPLADKKFTESNKWAALSVTMLFTQAKIVLYIGWLKCMGIVLNPFGKDDDDFELEYYLGRHYKVINAYMDTPMMTLPAVAHDQRLSNYLSHTVASAITAITHMPEKKITVQNEKSLRRRRKRASSSAKSLSLRSKKNN